MKVPLLVAALALAAVGFVAPADEAEATHGPMPVVQGYYYNYGHEVSQYWTPASLSIAEGETISFRNAVGTHYAWTVDGGCALPCYVTMRTLGTRAFYCLYHDMQGEITVLDVPSVAIATPTAGSTVTGVVTISGNATSLDSIIGSVSIYVDGVKKGDAATSPGPTATWTFELDTRTVLNGVRQISAHATSAAGVIGSSTVAANVLNPLLPELSVTSTSSRSYGLGTQILITARNSGNANPGQFPILLEYEYKGQWRTVATLSPNGLAPGAQATYDFRWTNAFLVGEFPLRATVDPANKILELDETNNVRLGTMVFHTSAVWGMDVRNPDV